MYQANPQINEHFIVFMGYTYGGMLLIFGIIFAVGMWLVADRAGKNKWIWAILSIIPFVNFFFFIYAFFAVLIYALDRLNQAAPRHRALA